MTTETTTESITSLEEWLRDQLQVPCEQGNRAAGTNTCGFQPAKWVIKYACPECGFTETKLYCDMHKDCARSLYRWRMPCCGALAPMKVLHLDLLNRKGNRS